MGNIYIFRVVVVLKKWKQVFPSIILKQCQYICWKIICRQERGISPTGNKGTLAKNAFYAYFLNLPVNKSEEEEVQCYQNDKTNFL